MAALTQSTYFAEDTHSLCSQEPWVSGANGFRCEVEDCQGFFPRTTDSPSLAADRLRTAVLQVQWAMTAGYLEGTPPPAAAWETLVALAEPRIRVAIRATGACGPDVDDCVQETWLEVLKGIDQLDPCSTGKGIACWLQTVARRTAVRFRRRQAHGILGCVPVPGDGPDAWEDPRQLDPANASIEGEAKDMLRESIHSLLANLGEETHRVVARYLAGETNLTAIARDLGISRGRLFHSWRTALRFLHRDLA